MRGYSVNLGAQALSAAATSIIELSAAAAKALLIIRATLVQQGNTTSAQQGIQLARQSTSGTNVTTPATNPDDVSDTALGATAKGLQTTQGTLGAVLYPDAFNWQNPWQYVPVPEERKTISAGGFAALRTLTTPPAQTISSNVQVLEIG